MRMRYNSLLFAFVSGVSVYGCSDDSGEGGEQATEVTPSATAVGAVSGEATSATIGEAGGTLTSSDGRLTLNVPNGALTADTTISVTPIENNAHGGVGAAYRLTPDGQTFAVAVTLAFATTSDDLQGASTGALGVAFQTSEGFWQWLGTPTVSGDVVEVSSTHFTDFSMVKGFQLRPASADVQVDATQRLDIALCYPQSVDADDLQPLGFACGADSESLAPPLVASNWSVNGIAGGSADVGTIVGSGASATFTAPSVVPSANPVAVSVVVNNGGSGQTIIVSNLEIVDAGADYAGVVNWSSSHFADGVANVQFHHANTIGDIDAYFGVGSISADVSMAGCVTQRVTANLDTTTDPDAWHLHSYLRRDSDADAFEFVLISETKTVTYQCGESPNTYTSDADVTILIEASACSFDDESVLPNDGCFYYMDTLDFAFTKN